MQPESLSELQKSAAVINHLESAVLGGRKIPIQSFDAYLARRDHMPDTMQEYQKAIQQFGFINQLNIATTNSEVFKKIVEFEVAGFSPAETISIFNGAATSFTQEELLDFHEAVGGHPLSISFLLQLIQYSSVVFDDVLELK